MDPLTHSATGLLLAKAGLERLTRNWIWVILPAASAPDIDGLFALPGDARILDLHRHFTHAIPFAPLMALAVVLGVRYILRRQIDFPGAFLLALAGVLSHDAIDFLTYRGTRIWLPFDDHFHALGIESFFDPIYFSLLLCGLALPLLGNLVSGEIGARRSRGAGTAILFLVLATGWLYARVVMRAQALTEAQSRVYDGLDPRRVDLLPTLNPLQFNVLIDTGRFVRETEVDLLHFFDPDEGQTYFPQVPSVEAGRALQVAGATRQAQFFLAWARWPRWRVNHYDGSPSWVVVIEELASDRFKTQPRVVVKMNERYEVLEEKYERARSTSGF